MTAKPHWINAEPVQLTTDGRFRCTVKTRYRQRDVPCMVTRGTGDDLRVDFDTPQWAVTPGQYAVFYAGDECLGGAPIDSSWSAQNPVALTGAPPL